MDVFCFVGVALSVVWRPMNGVDFVPVDFVPVGLSAGMGLYEAE